MAQLQAEVAAMPSAEKVLALAAPATRPRTAVYDAKGREIHQTVPPSWGGPSQLLAIAPALNLLSPLPKAALSAHAPGYLTRSGSVFPASSEEEALSRCSLYMAEQKRSLSILKNEVALKRMALLKAQLAAERREEMDAQLIAHTAAGEYVIGALQHRLERVQEATSEVTGLGISYDRIAALCSQHPPKDDRHLGALEEQVRLASQQVVDLVARAQALVMQRDDMERGGIKQLREHLAWTRGVRRQVQAKAEELRSAIRMGRVMERRGQAAAREATASSTDPANANSDNITISVDGQRSRPLSANESDFRNRINSSASRPTSHTVSLAEKKEAAQVQLQALVRANGADGLVARLSELGAQRARLEAQSRALQHKAEQLRARLEVEQTAAKDQLVAEITPNTTITNTQSRTHTPDTIIENAVEKDEHKHIGSNAGIIYGVEGDTLELGIPIKNLTGGDLRRREKALNVRLQQAEMRASQAQRRHHMAYTTLQELHMGILHLARLYNSTECVPGAKLPLEISGPSGAQQLLKACTQKQEIVLEALDIARKAGFTTPRLSGPQDGGESPTTSTTTSVDPIRKSTPGVPDVPPAAPGAIRVVNRRRVDVQFERAMADLMHQQDEDLELAEAESNNFDKLAMQRGLASFLSGALTMHHPVNHLRRSNMLVMGRQGKRAGFGLVMNDVLERAEIDVIAAIGGEKKDGVSGSSEGIGRNQSILKRSDLAGAAYSREDLKGNAAYLVQKKHAEGRKKHHLAKRKKTIALASGGDD